MQWEVVIGLETHVQLSTASKIFSGASCAFGAEPNTQACYIDLALPGALPVLNIGAVDKAIRFGLAIGAEVAEKSVFDRKNYFYPDLPKGYQISQFDLPVVKGGKLTFTVEPKNGEPYVKTINLTRAHLEEDAGKSIHGIVAHKSGMDLNRAGTPLLEIVTEPELRSSAEAVGYAKALHALVVWLGISHGNMQEGNFRCDANVSVRPMGETKFGTRCEIKNINSFKFLQDAIDYEVNRQIELIEAGGKVVQATRLYDPDRNETRQMRTKEDSMDYRYFPEPDLVPIVVSDEWLQQIRDNQPELHDEKLARYIAEFGLPEYDAQILTSEKKLADLFEATSAICNKPKKVSNWLMGETMRLLKDREMDAEDLRFSPEHLAKIIELTEAGTINNSVAKEVFEKVFDEDIDPECYVEEHGLKSDNDEDALRATIEQIVKDNPQSVEDYHNGKEKAIGFLVGQTMKATKGKANPGIVNKILKELL